MPRIISELLLCNRCNYQWKPHKDNQNPKRCAKCRSPYWDSERKNTNSHESNVTENEV